MKTFRITFTLSGMEGYLRCKVQAPDCNFAINALLDKVQSKVNPVGLGIASSIFEELNEKTNKFRRIG